MSLAANLGAGNVRVGQNGQGSPSGEEQISGESTLGIGLQRVHIPERSLRASNRKDKEDNPRRSLFSTLRL
jgi:hypothetical protein